MELSQIGGVVSQWAHGKPPIKRVHLFGSRVRDDHGPTSDIDIAVELDPSAFSGSDESGGLATWMFEAQAWRKELQALIPLKVQLERYHPEQTPTVNSSLKKERIKKRIYRNREIARADIADYIESFYNRTRRHSYLGGVSPEEFELAGKRGYKRVQ